MDWEAFVDEAYAYLSERIDEAMHLHHLGDYQEYAIDQASATIQFLSQGAPKLAAHIQIVGSLSKTTNTWLWSWANQHVLDASKDKLSLLQSYGKENAFEKLTTDKWPADEADGWEMTAIASYLFQAEGAYRVPTEAGFVYMTLSDFKPV